MYSVKMFLEIGIFIVIWNLFYCNYLIVLHTSKINKRIILLQAGHKNTNNNLYITII